MGKLLEELKRRKVVKVAAVYAVVAWIIIQVADTVLPALQLPDWTVTFFTVLFILGFPLALILAWAYELTPEGAREELRAPSSSPDVHHSDRKLIYATFVLVLMVAGFQIADRFLLESSDSTPIASVGVASVDEQLTIRSSINLGPATDAGGGRITKPAISPDGSRIAYTKILDDGAHLYLRDLNQLEARELTGLGGATASMTPFFSPDSQQIAYREGGNLMRVSVRGDSPQILASGLQESIIAWESDQSILYTAGPDRSLYRIAAVGGEPQPLQLDIPGEEEQLAPHVLPGGKALLYNGAAGRVITRGIRLANLETGEVRTLIERGYAGRYAASGHIVFMRAATLWAVPFDLERLELAGPAVPVVQGVQTISGQGLAGYSFSDNGRLVYRPGNDILAGNNASTLVWFDREGNEEPLDLALNQYSAPQLSPNGALVSLTVPDGNGNSDIWIYDLRRGVLSRQTFTGAADSAIWTPDGENLIFSIREQEWGLWIVAANGTGEARLLVQEDDISRAETFSPDGEQLVYRKGLSTGTLYVASLTGETTQNRLFSNQATGLGSQISPDGRWIAYHSYETGQWEVYVRNYPDVDAGKWQISSDGGQEPRWGPEGKELYYRSGTPPNIEIRTVSIESGADFIAGIPETLFVGNFAGHGTFGGGVLSYNVSADGQRFLMNKNSRVEVASSGRNEPSLVLVENWFAELKRLAPPDMETSKN